MPGIYCVRLIVGEYLGFLPKLFYSNSNFELKHGRSYGEWGASGISLRRNGSSGVRIAVRLRC